MPVDIINSHESNVRSYCRSFPAIFVKAQGSTIEDVTGRPYLDFFSGAGALNYGHNHPRLKKALLEYIEQNGIIHSLDMVTQAKIDFIDKFCRVILQPRQLDYKLQFVGPTGTNAVESALKLARKITGRKNVVAFTRAFHGMTLGSLSVSGLRSLTHHQRLSLPETVFMPFDQYHAGIDSIAYMDQLLGDPYSGIAAPAAFIVETVQAEGGINVASVDWLRRLQQLAAKYESLLIVDDIQVGCGRTGKFFSFERANLIPDIICLSKSLSGYGLPLSLVLLKPELDQWQPGEHNGTFRGNNSAFITATAALDFWEDAPLMETNIQERVNFLKQACQDIVNSLDQPVLHKQCGLIQGLEFPDVETARQISKRCFEQGVIIETAGAKDQVLKFLPALTITKDDLQYGMEIVRSAIFELLPQRTSVRL